MNRSLPFFYSLALHLFLILLAWGTFNTVRTIEQHETKLRISLLAPEPKIAPEPSEPMPPEPTPPEPKSEPVIKPIPKPQTPITHKPVVKAPEPIPPKSEPVTPTPPAAQKSVPVASKPVPVETEVKPAPPSPPPVNVQAKYEEENLNRIRAILAERLTYPKNALRLQQQGDVIASFSITPGGDVTNITISKSSEFELLDNAALRLIESSASAFPKPSKTVRITVPIGYKIR